MSKTVKTIISTFDFYLLRSPLLSANQIFKFNNDLSTNTLKELIIAAFQDISLQEALYLASTDLYAEMKHLLANPNAGSGDKVLLSLYKYLLRAGVRCTPYGMFAGCALGTISENDTALIRDDKQLFEKYSRLDISCTIAILAVIQKEYSNKLLFYPNTSIYQIHDKYRYIESRLENQQISYLLNSVDASEYLEKIFNHAQKGALKEGITAILINDEITSEEAGFFIDELIECQLLTCLEPSIAGREYLDILIDLLNEVPEAEGINGVLKSIQELLKKNSDAIRNFDKIQELISVLVPGEKFKSHIQTDATIKTVKNNISEDVASQICENLEHLFTLQRKSDNYDLNTFKQKFKSRYEDNEVPLTSVLDVEAGIGYSIGTDNLVVAPLIDDVGEFTVGSTSSFIEWNKFSRLKLKIFNSYLSDKQTEYTITRDEIDEYGDKQKLEDIPDNFAAQGTFINNPEGQLFLLKSCGGPSAANLMARFCYGNEGLTEKLKACLKTEESYSEHIFAEVVHLPNGRVGNVLTRPSLRDYEICFLGGSDLEASNKIHVRDLMVSVIQNEVILRSKRLNKRIIPRMSNAHNFHNDKTIIYRFLCDLQSQNLVSGTSWDWGIFKDQPFLPRVKLGNLIVSRAVWSITEKELGDLKSKKEQIHKIKNLIKQRNLPSIALLAEHDNEMLIDFNADPAVEILLDYLKKYKIVSLTEFIQSPEQCVVNGTGRSVYTNEVIIPFGKNVEKKHNTEPLAKITTDVRYRESFSIGTEWAYFKIYCGPASAENILHEIIYPLVHDFITSGLVEKFFFIRYKDPDNHLRVRFYNKSDKDFWKTVTERLLHALKASISAGIVHKVYPDEYKPEYDRYGFDSIAISEQIFNHDSLAVLKFINLTADDPEQEEYRWLFALKGVDDLFSGCGINLIDRSKIISDLSTLYHIEFGGDGKQLVQVINDKYRANAKKIEILFSQPEMILTNDLMVILNSRLKTLAAEFYELQLICDQDRVKDLLGSYLHMFLNRLFTINGRKHDLVICHYLERYYKSKIARENKHILIDRISG
jgi:thiopeptide-type bacteriocin biosynthesis protein